MDISAVVALATEVGILRVGLETEHQKSGYNRQKLHFQLCVKCSCALLDAERKDESDITNACVWAVHDAVGESVGVGSSEVIVVFICYLFRALMVMHNSLVHD